jgi:photosynthetic reaction center H subunit
MQNVVFTNSIDVAQVTLYAFFIFFAGLIFYLRREDKREGYPLESDRSERTIVQGFPTPPSHKIFRLRSGKTATVPNRTPDRREIHGEPVAPWPGAPLEPTGDPMLDGLGPAAFAERQDEPELTLEGKPSIAPMRIATDVSIDREDPDPRGMDVFGADGAVAGTVSDVWVDRAEGLIRYLEVDVPSAEGSRRVLLPMTMARVRVTGWRRYIKVKAILASQFAAVPATQSTDQVTKREEDRICAYYAGGTLYATPLRREAAL